MKTRLSVNSSKVSLKHNRTLPLVNTTLATIVLCSVSVVTQAADTTSASIAMSSYSIKVVKKQDNGATVQIGESKVQNTKSSQSSINSNNRNIRLDVGGVVWVSNDPAPLTPILDVTTSKDVEMGDKSFKSPISFALNTNYAAFIDEWELSVYDENDDDERKPLVTFMGRSLVNGQLVKWNGTTTKGKSLAAGDRLKYILKVRDKAGHSDRTHARHIVLQGAGSHFDETKVAASHNLVNNLQRQTIPLHGSRIRLFGSDIADNQSLSIDGERVKIKENKFVIERILPEGQHQFDVEIKSKNGVEHKRLGVNIDEKYLFMVGIADITAGKGKVTGNLESLSDGDKYLDGDVFIDGRLAFYLKGKIKGKYLVTAQMDTGTADIEELFDNIHKKDTSSLFRRLDPDKYYPVYGDDSTLVNDTNSQGKIYVRVDWDKSRGIWGNYNTDMTGTELSAFNRSLYGAKLNHKSIQVTKEGQHKTDLTVFASEAQSAYRHNQFLGTGGSLYYLKDSDIVDGSEKVWVEVRDKNSDRAVDKIIMEEGRDYEIDDFQGRIILHRPLLQIAEQSNPSLVKDNPLDGNQVYLMVDYEYVPDDFDSNKASYGGRGKVWLNDHVAVGGSYAHENRNDDDYDLKGVDITLQKAKGTYVVAEYAESESLQTQGSFTSNDGGLNFKSFNDPADHPKARGAAYSIEARANLEDLVNKPGSVGAWYKHRDAGFSTSRLEQGTETVDAGIEALFKATENFNATLKATLNDKKGERKLSTVGIQGDYAANNKTTLSAEVRHVKEEDQSVNAGTAQSIDGEGTLAAFKIGYDANKNVNLYAIAQSALKKSGNYKENDLITLGVKARINQKLALSAEVSAGDRGEAATLGVDYKLNDSHTFYSNYTLSKNTNRNIFTVGQRKSVSDRLKVFSEHQFTREKTKSGIGHSFGLDYDYTKNVALSVSAQTASLNNESGSTTDRDAFSVGLSYKKGKTNASTRLEYRHDKGSSANEETEQWVTTNRVNYRFNPSFRLQGKFNYSETKDKAGNTRDAKFTEASLGFALRPVDNDRLNVLGRLTYLYDLQPLSQGDKTDEKSLIASIETSYQVSQKWEIGGKLAHKQGELRTQRNAGTWEKNDASLAAARVRYHLTHNWDAMAEYHWMNSDASQDSQHGAMISVDRHIGKNFKVGVGYNFTDFTDDLSSTDGTAKGWFINLVGKF